MTSPRPDAGRATPSPDAPAPRRVEPALVEGLPPLPRWLRCPPPAAVFAFVPVAIGLVVWAVRLDRFDGSAWVLDVALGLAGWTLLEYVSHRFLLHAVPRSPRARALNLHLRHHLDPADLAYQAIPFWVTVPIACALLPALALALGTWAGAALCTASLISGYLVYEYVHLRVHLPGGGRMVRALRRHHLYHHHVDAGAAFGFTSPLWDVVFRTHRRRGSR